MMNLQKPVVAHIMRSYLDPSETFISNQIATLQAFEPIVLCHHRRDELSHSSIDLTSVADLLLPFPQFIDRWAYRIGRATIPPAIDSLAQYIHKRNVKLLHFHYLVDARFFLALIKKMELPCLVSAYGYDVSSFPRAYGGYGRCYLKPLFGQADNFIAMSQDMRRDLIALGCPPEKIIVHYHGIDIHRFIYPERVYNEIDPVTILTCGDLFEKKAQNKILQALRLVEQKKMTKKDFRLSIVGEGPMRSMLEQQISEYGWKNKVVLYGHIPHQEERLIDIYRHADIFCLPSITAANGDKEGIPGVIVEAMSSGLPVISTYHAGIPEIIDNGRDGLLVEEGDLPAMAKAFASLMNDAQLRRTLGQRAVSRAVNELNLQKGKADLEAIYRNVMGR